MHQRSSNETAVNKPEENHTRLPSTTQWQYVWGHWHNQTNMMTMLNIMNINPNQLYWTIQGNEKTQQCSRSTQDRVNIYAQHNSDNMSKTTSNQTRMLQRTVSPSTSDSWKGNYNNVIHRNNHHAQQEHLQQWWWSRVYMTKSTRKNHEINQHRNVHWPS